MNKKCNKNIDNDFIETVCKSEIANLFKVASNRCDIRNILHNFITRIDCCIGSN